MSDKICRHCGSTNVGSRNRYKHPPKKKIVGFAIQYYCKDCGRRT